MSTELINKVLRFGEGRGMKQRIQRVERINALDRPDGRIGPEPSPRAGDGETRAMLRTCSDNVPPIPLTDWRAIHSVFCVGRRFPKKITVPPDIPSSQP